METLERRIMTITTDMTTVTIFPKSFLFIILEKPKADKNIEHGIINVYPPGSR
jgi:hypothetical protein